MGEIAEVVSQSEERMEEEEEENEEERRTKEAVLRWERFLPRMVLRVLLVEADDSTRQIIAALLRKCSYRVAAVPDGLKAWETLKGRPQNIDIILTEVELPSISGYALLTLIMEHDVCKNIPVIMMSSKDSISTVLKCMLKGAADFLIKPVRKNELKNLWQHVWRRRIQMAGNVRGSTSIAGREVEATSGNKVEHNHSGDDRSKKSSGKHGDAQSSSTTPYFEAESAYMQNMQGLSHPECTSPSNLSNRKQEECRLIMEKLVRQESEEREANATMTISGSERSQECTTVDLRSGEVHECAEPLATDREMQPEITESPCIVGEVNRPTNDFIEPHEAIDFIGRFGDHLSTNGKNLFAHEDTKNEGMATLEATPELDLSLKRFSQTCLKEVGTEEQNGLNHSKSSAFSRYDNNKMLPVPQLFTSVSNQGASKEQSNPSQTSYHLPSFCTSWGQNAVNQKNETAPPFGYFGKPEAAFLGRQLSFIPAPGLSFDGPYASYGAAYPPMFYARSGFSPVWSPKSQKEESPMPTNSSIYSTSEVLDSEQSFHLCNDITNRPSSNQAAQTASVNLKTAKPPQHFSSLPSSKPCSDTENKTSSTVCGSRSNMSNGNVSPASELTRASMPDTATGQPILVGDGLQVTNSSSTSLREAALMKFRLKRKERCYEKKVRYQSRKKLAEQRPRVKGQFVRQAQDETSTVD